MITDARVHRVLLAVFLGLFACTACTEREVDTIPVGPLTLPTEYESHRVAFRGEIADAGETVVAEMQGEGCLRHLWMTTQPIVRRPETGLLITLRVYVDGSEVPSVEVPVGPFFGLHHGHAPVDSTSAYLSVTARGGLNAYFPMPFQNGMKITLEVEGGSRQSLWLQADYHRYESGALTESLRFHAAYRRVQRAERFGRPYHIGHASGRGVIVGVSMGMRVLDRVDHWYHCGGDLVLLDGNTSDAHILSGIGGEDFFGTAWGQSVFEGGSIGCPYYDSFPGAADDEPVVVFSAYRFFDRDPITFRESFWYDFGSLANDMSSVIYWYQDGTAESPSPSSSAPPRLPEDDVGVETLGTDRGTAQTWQVCGPFLSVAREEFERHEFPEDGVDLDQKASADFGQYAEAARGAHPIPGPDYVTHWVSSVPSRNRFVDLTPYFRPRLLTNGGLPVEVSAYAATTIAARRSGEARVRIGHDDWFKVWVNGELVYRGEEYSGFRTEELKIALVEGDNHVLVKAANRENTNFRAWVFLFDVLDHL